jgi:hypothetical protein
VGLELAPLSLVSITEELLGRKSSRTCLENSKYGRRDPSCWSRGTFYPQKLALTSPTSGGLSVGIVLSQPQTTENFSTFRYITPSIQTKITTKVSREYLSSTSCQVYILQAGFLLRFHFEGTKVEMKKNSDETSVGFQRILHVISHGHDILSSNLLTISNPEISIDGDIKFLDSQWLSLLVRSWQEWWWY